MTQTNIVASVFGGPGDREVSAYTGKLLSGSALYVALPAHVTAPRPLVRVTNRQNRKTAVGSIEDVGPWNTTDAYWLASARPQAESGRDMHGRHTNRAGIDLSPALAKAIGIDGMGHVDWEFVSEDQNTQSPSA